MLKRAASAIRIREPSKEFSPVLRFRVSRGMRLSVGSMQLVRVFRAGQSVSEWASGFSAAPAAIAILPQRRSRELQEPGIYRRTS